MARNKEGFVRKRSISPDGYNVVWEKYQKRFGIIVPKDMCDISKEYRISHETELPVIGFLVDSLGRIFFKAIDIPSCYGYIENGEINDFFSSDDHGGSSFCTLTTVRAAFFETLMWNRYNEITEINAKRLIEWLERFDNILDRKLYKRHHMYRIGMTKDGQNTGRMILDPSIPTVESIRRRLNP